MPGRSARSRKWIAGALHAGRAAAFLTIATGVNGTLAALWPRYEPIYVYLVAVVIIAALTSALLGLTSAVAAVVLYDWMFAPVRIVPSLSIAIPFTVAVLVAISTRAMMQVQRRAALAVPAEPPLLPAIDHPAPVDRPSPAIDVVAGDDRSAGLEQQLATARSQVQSEVRLRADAGVAARARETALEKEIETLRGTVAQQGSESASSQRDFDALIRRVNEAESRVSALQQGIEAAQRRADEHQSRATHEAGLREKLEVAGHESMQKAISDLSAKHEATSLEAKQRLEVATKKLQAAQKELTDARARAEREAALREQTETSSAAKLQKSLIEVTEKYEAAVADAQKRAEAAASRIKAMQLELDRTLASLGEQHGRADREAKLRSQLETAARKTLHLTADVSATHQREAVEARELALAADERARLAEEQLAEARASHDQRAEAAQSDQRAAALEAEIIFARQAIEEQMARADRESAAREEMEAEARSMSMRYESALAQSRDQLETLGRDATLLEQELAAKQSEVEAERKKAGEVHAQREAAMREFDQKLQTIVAGITNDYESAIGDALVEKEAAKAELRNIAKKMQESQALRTELDGARRELEFARAAAAAERQRAAELESERDKMTSDFDVKLQHIIAGITSDYENTIGDALVDREAAKAELRDITKKMQQLQTRFAGSDDIQTQLQRSNGELREALEQERRRVSEEKSLREQMDADFSEKLQKIVSHLAEDHEADIGEAMVQKEGAKAEARNLNSRLAAMQQRLEEEREKFRQAAERWQQERASLVSQAAGAEPASRRPAFPPTIEQPAPQPESTRAAVVLVVHSDPAIRTMFRDALQQDGYTVLTAADGLEGMRTATQHKPDVVFAQAVMPKMNARELVQLLKSRQETANVKIILMSAGGELARSTDFRADEVVRNPADINDLRAALTNVLSRRGVAS